MTNDVLGGFEQQVLLAVMRLGGDAYGVPIADTIEAACGREIGIGRVYIVLHRLEDKGLITSRLGEPTPERGGRAKRYFQITGNGLRAAQRTPVKMWSRVSALQERTA